MAHGENVEQQKATAGGSTYDSGADELRSFSAEQRTAGH